MLRAENLQRREARGANVVVLHPLIEDEGSGSTAVVLGFIRALAEAGDDGAHNCAEAFADNE